MTVCLGGFCCLNNFMNSAVAEEPLDVNFVAARVADENCLREFNKAGSDSNWKARPVSDWQVADLHSELDLLKNSFEAWQKAEPNADKAVARTLASVMTFKVASAAVRLAENDVVSARQELEEAASSYNQTMIDPAKQITLERELRELGYAGDRYRMIDTLRLMLTKDRLQKYNIAAREMRRCTVKKTSTKRRNEPGVRDLWRAECVLAKTQANLAFALLDEDQFIANLDSVMTISNAKEQGQADRGEQNAVVDIADETERKNLPDLVQELSLDTLQLIGEVHDQFEKAKTLLEENGGEVKRLNIEGPVFLPLDFLGSLRLDADRDGIVTRLELGRLKDSFSRDYPIEFVQGVLSTLKAMETELETSKDISQSRLIELATSHGFESGRIYRVKGSAPIYFDFLNYARSHDVEQTNGKVTESLAVVTGSDLSVEYENGDKVSVYQIALQRAKLTSLEPR